MSAQSSQATDISSSGAGNDVLHAPLVKGGESHIPALDGLRGLAVILVVLYHFAGGTTSSNPVLHWAGEIVHFGSSGVTLFFILSGFLITGILWDTRGEPGALRNFYIRRSFRIFPLYYATLFLALIMAACTGVFRSTLGFIWIPFLYLQNIGHFDYFTYMPVRLWMVHYWSLAVEEHFYLLWPFVLLMMRNTRAAARLSIGLFLFSAVVPILAVRYWNFLLLCDYPLLANAGSLALGGWMALAHRTHWKALVPWFPRVGLASLIVFLAVALHRSGFEFRTIWSSAIGTTAIVLILACLLGMCLQPGIIQRLLSAAWLRWVGKVSFGIYVFHLLFVSQLNQLTGYLISPAHRFPYLGLRLVLDVVLTPLLAWLSFTYFEKPFLRLKDRLAPRRATL